MDRSPRSLSVGERWGIMMKVRTARRRTLVVAIAALSVLGLGGAVVFASHDFTDVPTSAYYHDAVDWIADRGITSGCSATQYCPNNAVKRGDMALFLQRLGQVVEPVLATDDENGVTLDIDADPVVCQTTAVLTGAYPKVAIFNGHFSGYNGGASDIEFLARAVYSTNGGSTWSTLLSQTVDEAPSGTANDNDWDSVPVGAHRSFATGQSVRFGIQVSRSANDAETFDFEKYNCYVQTQIINNA